MTLLLETAKDELRELLREAIEFSGEDGPANDERGTCYGCGEQVQWGHPHKDDCPYRTWLQRARAALVDSGKEKKELPPPFLASTLRLIADHFDAPQGKKIIINPSAKMREEWAILLNQIADDLEGG